MASSSKDDNTKEVTDMFKNLLPTPSPSKRQKILDFKTIPPDASQHTLNKEDNKYKEEKQKKEAKKQEIAEEWGLPWPRAIRKDTRRGGPRAGSLAS